MLIRIRAVVWTARARGKAESRGITEEDVEDVLRHRPLTRQQKRKLEQSEGGEWRLRPQRVLVIGETRHGEILTMVFEMPDANGRAVAVTAWPSGENDIARYGQYIGTR